ncbi:hypothetical protein J7426_14430 [Tropicibacter sp. R16_0]|uniref:hypothetical protein n=1 Tax=Tropicibacter sp. R16_0 TaxID=2821102 RepID=UPI001ADB19BB|nr:hypothetical protein [Tropicibacter sp. R16_0]MBO9451467.1 hypothetical protein [Tropicibacter sp. R16_0]
MQVVQSGLCLGKLCEYLGGYGLEIEEISDVSEIPNLVKAAQKPYLTPLSSPEFNDFTWSNSIWLVAKRAGQPVYLGCARLEDIGGEPIESYWSRTFSRAYGHGFTKQIIGNVRPEITRNLKGRLVYFGDLFVCETERGSRNKLRAFIAIGQLAAVLKWNPDWIYCFVRKRDIMRGASALYGFNRNFGPPFDWVGTPPAPRDRSEWLVGVSREDLPVFLNETTQEVVELKGCSSDNEKAKV